MVTLRRFDSWLAGVQPVRNQWQFFRWTLPPMLPVSHKESIAPNHKSLYLDILFASIVSKGSVKDCELNHPKVATLI